MTRSPRARRLGLLLTLVLGAALLPACAQSDASSLRLTLRSDLSGTLLCSSVATRKADDGPVQAGVTGAQWKAAGTLIVAGGEFTDITALNVGGITFSSSMSAGAPLIRLTFPRGADARWPALFTVVDREVRKSTARALDPTARASSIGEAIKIQVTVPGQVVSAGTDNRERGVNSSFEETIATLMIPAEVAASAGRPFTWHITWKEQSVP